MRINVKAWPGPEFIGLPQRNEVGQPTIVMSISK